MLKIKDIELKLQLEKMVIGLEEPILIKGGGKFIAKVDSGNGGYNVIHGEDFVKQGDILNFKTYDADGNERRISKKISDVVNINIGGGNIQERPVVELDIKFADEEYRKIPFSVTDRSSNSQKVLLSKDFVKNELQALIDVGKTNMTENEPVEVEYVTEAKNANREKPLKTGIFHPINDVKQGYRNTKNVLKRSAKHPIKAGLTAVNKVTDFFDTLGHGFDRFNSYLPDDTNDTNEKSATGNAEVDKKIGELPKVIKDDEQLILTRIKQEMSQITQAVSPNKDPNNTQEINFNVVRILDYTNHGITGPAFEVENSLIGKDKDLNALAAEKVKNTQPNASSKDQNFNNSNDTNSKAQPASQVKNVNSSYFDRWMARYEYLTEGKGGVEGEIELDISNIVQNAPPIQCKYKGRNGTITVEVPLPNGSKGNNYYFSVDISKIGKSKINDKIQDTLNNNDKIQKAIKKIYGNNVENAAQQPAQDAAPVAPPTGQSTQPEQETNNQPAAAQPVPSDEQSTQTTAATDAPADEQPAQDAAAPATAQVDDKQPVAATDAPADEQPTSSQPENDEAFKKELAELNKKLQDEISRKNQFCFYFCGDIPKDNIMQMFNSVNEPYSNKSISFLNNMTFNEGAFNSYALQLTQDLKNTNAYNNGCCGLYALCVGNTGGRRVKLFYDQNVVLPSKK